MHTRYCFSSSPVDTNSLPPRYPSNCLHLGSPDTGDLCSLTVNTGKLGIDILAAQRCAGGIIGPHSDSDIESVPVDNRSNVASRVENGRIECPNLIPSEDIER